MTSPDESLDEFLARHGSPTAPNWETGNDLMRLSAVAAARAFGEVGALIPSGGRLRLSGEGVDENRLPVDAASRVMATTQRMVTAIGASLEGFRQARGAFASHVTEATRIDLIAAPSPGSLVLEFSAGSDQRRELHPGGVVPFHDDERSLLDRSFDQLLDLIAIANEAQANADPLVERIEELGPRVATALRGWSDALSANFIDADIAWSDVRANLRSARLDRQTAHWLHDVVEGRKLDAEPDTLTGIARTVSDVSKWRIDTDEGAVFVDVSDLGPGEISVVNVGDTVRLNVLVQIVARPGGGSSAVYSARSLISDET